MRLNLPITGFLIGLVTPFFGLIVVYNLWGHGEGLDVFVRSLFVLKDLSGKVFTLSLLANLIPFLFFNVKRYDYALRGVVVATMLYAVFIFLTKFIW
jgi:hypothetical protein